MENFSPLRPNIELSDQMRLNELYKALEELCYFVQISDKKPDGVIFYEYFGKYITVDTRMHHQFLSMLVLVSEIY